MRLPDVDVFYVDPRHDAIDARLRNWAAWAAVRPHYATSPMFKAMGYRSNSRQWHPPEIKDAINIKDAIEVERVVSAMPALHRMIVRWFYVYRTDTRRFCHKIGMQADTLRQYCADARDMVQNCLSVEFA